MPRSLFSCGGRKKGSDVGVIPKEQRHCLTLSQENDHTKGEPSKLLRFWEPSGKARVSPILDVNASGILSFPPFGSASTVFTEHLGLSFTYAGEASAVRSKDTRVHSRLSTNVSAAVEEENSGEYPSRQKVHEGATVSNGKISLSRGLLTHQTPSISVYPLHVTTNSSHIHKCEVAHELKSTLKSSKDRWSSSAPIPENDHQTEVNSLKKQVGHLKHKKNMLKQQLKVENKQLEDTRQALNSKQIAFDEVKDELEGTNGLLKTQTIFVDEQLKSAKDSHRLKETAERERNQAQELTEVFRHQVQSLERQIAASRQDAQRAEGMCNTLAKEKRQMEESMSQELNQNRNLYSENARLHQALARDPVQQNLAVLIENFESQLRGVKHALIQKSQACDQLNQANDELARQYQKLERERQIAVTKKVRDFTWHIKNNANGLVPKPNDVVQAQKAQEAAQEMLKKANERHSKEREELTEDLKSAEVKYASLRDNYQLMIDELAISEHNTKKAKAGQHRWAAKFQNAKHNFGKKQHPSKVNSMLADKLQKNTKELEEAAAERDDLDSQVKRLQLEVANNREKEARHAIDLQVLTEELDKVTNRANQAESTQEVEAEAHAQEVEELKQKIDQVENENKELTAEAFAKNCFNSSPALRNKIEEKDNTIDYFRDQLYQYDYELRRQDFESQILRQGTAKDLISARQWLQERNLAQVQVDAFRDRFRDELELEPLVIKKEDLQPSASHQERLAAIDESIAQNFADTYGGGAETYREEMAPNHNEIAMAKLRADHCTTLEADPLIKIVSTTGMQESDSESGSDKSKSDAPNAKSTSSSDAAGQNSSGNTTPESNEQAPDNVKDLNHAVPSECLNDSATLPGPAQVPPSTETPNRPAEALPTIIHNAGEENDSPPETTPSDDHDIFAAYDRRRPLFKCGPSDRQQESSSLTSLLDDSVADDELPSNSNTDHQHVGNLAPQTPLPVGPAGLQHDEGAYSTNAATELGLGLPSTEDAVPLEAQTRFTPAVPPETLLNFGEAATKWAEERAAEIYMNELREQFGGGKLSQEDLDAVGEEILAMMNESLGK